MQEEMHKWVSLYSAEGFFLTPIEKNKKPILQDWPKLRLSEDEISTWIKKEKQIGIITGSASGITVIDIDLVAPGVFGTDPSVFPDTFTVRTPSGGLQKYYQYDPHISQSQQGFAKYPKVDIRNNGGQVGAVPSSMDYMKKYEGKEPVHIIGSYTVESGSIVNLAPFPIHLFQEYVIHENREIKKPLATDRPGDVFNASTVSWDDLLCPLGFVRGATDKKSTHWVRPGKNDGSTGATTKVCEDGVERLFVFSTNAHPFESWSAEKHNSYTKFQVFALLYHQGDFSSAARDVKKQGFSSPADTPTKPPAPVVPAESMNITCLNDIEEEPIDWIWRGKIARGELCIIAGEPGAGKTLISADIAARISTGSTLPLSTECMAIGSVVFLTSENDPAKVLRPRLVAAGADLKKIHLLSSSVHTIDAKGKKKSRHVALAEDAEKIGSILSKVEDIVALVIDPISEYMGGKDSNSNSDVRDVLATLTDQVRDKNVAIIAVTHYNKKVEITSSSARINGSIGFAGAARTAFAVGKFYDDEWSDEEKEARKDQMAFSSVKNNLSGDKGGYVYRIKSFIYTKNGIDIETAKLEWMEAIAESADDLLRRVNKKEGRPRILRDECAQWLTAFLSNYPDGAARADVVEEAARHGFSRATVDRAKKELVIITDAKTGLWTLFTGDF